MKKLMAIAPMVFLLASCGRNTTTTPIVEDVQQPQVIIVEEIVEQVELEPIVEVEPEPTTEPSETVEPTTVTYRVTAYCPCEKCCGKWGKNRPLDENGEPIVIGAWGVRLVDRYSVASPMAFGTTVELAGIGVVEVQDRTAKWIVDKYGENIIDLYMTDHEEARRFGVQYIEGVIK